MNKIICNSIEFVFVTEFAHMVSGQITLNPDAEWRNLNATEKPVYRAEIKQADSGPTKEETVTVTTRNDSSAVLKLCSNFPVILRLKTDSSTFLVGTIRYPAITEISSDEIHDNYTFKSKSTP